MVTEGRHAPKWHQNRPRTPRRLLRSRHRRTQPSAAEFRLLQRCPRDRNPYVVIVYPTNALAEGQPGFLRPPRAGTGIPSACAAQGMKTDLTIFLERFRTFLQFRLWWEGIQPQMTSLLEKAAEEEKKSAPRHNLFRLLDLTLDEQNT